MFSIHVLSKYLDLFIVLAIWDSRVSKLLPQAVLYKIMVADSDEAMACFQEFCMQVPRYTEEETEEKEKFPRQLELIPLDTVWDDVETALVWGKQYIKQTASRWWLHENVSAMICKLPLTRTELQEMFVLEYVLRTCSELIAEEDKDLVLHKKDFVEIHGLTNAIYLNGLKGKVVGFDALTKRYHIEVEGVGGKMIKRFNLKKPGKNWGIPVDYKSLKNWVVAHNIRMQFLA